MATLEVHDAAHQVRRVQISRDNPVMFGSDPMCDVVLEGPGIQPFHGRIRWKTRRFKADASPEVPWIEVNGLQVKSKSLYQGDEIKVGPCRIFLLSLEEGPDHGEKTVVQKTPTARTPGADRPSSPPAATDRPKKSRAADFMAMEMAPPSIELNRPLEPPAATPNAPLKRTKYRKPGSEPVEDLLVTPSGSFNKSAFAMGAESLEIPLPPEQAPLADRIRAIVPNFQTAPGDRRVLTSPMVVTLIVTLVVIVLFSAVLWRGISRATAHRIFSVASEDLTNNDFINAIRGFDSFLASNPDDSRANKARVLRALARVRQHTGPVGASWSAALTEAQAMVEEVGQTSEYRDSNMELAEDIRKATEGLADRATEQADAAALKQAESALTLHARVAGQAAPSLLERSKVPEKLEKARAAIRKSLERASTLAAMDAALKAKRPEDAYSARDRLTEQYHDLATDKEIVNRLVQANDLIRLAVTFDPSGRPAETEPHREPMGPTTSLVQRYGPDRMSSGSVAFALADGLAFGLDVASGSPRWQVPVGVSSPFPPIAIAGDIASVLVVDSRTDELERLDARNGALIWRQELGGSVIDPPLVLGNLILQPLPDGRLLQIDLASGGLRGTLKLGRRLTRSPVADDSAQHIYQLADEDCLFVLGLDPLACVAVEYLGHEPGSVGCSPGRFGRFFVLAENHEINQGRLKVFLLDEAGVKLKPVQEIPVQGWTRSTPASSGPLVWSGSDRGQISVFSVGSPDAGKPFTTIAQSSVGTEWEGPAYVQTRSDRDLTIGSARSGRYELDLDRGKLNPVWTLIEAGPALAAPQMFERLTVLTQQNEGTRGTAIWGVDSKSGEVQWRTTLGVRPTIPLASSPASDALIGLAADGRALSIERETLRKGAILEQPLPRPGTPRIPPGMTARIESDGLTILHGEPGSTRIHVRTTPSPDFRAIELPAPLASAILPLAGDLLIPGADGRVYLIDPKTGMATADPFVPPFDRNRPIRWRAPALLDGESAALADSDGTIRKLSVGRSPRNRLVMTAETRLDRAITAGPISTGASILVATSDGKVRSLASRDLGPQGTWPLDGPRVLGPVVVADHAFVIDATGQILAFGPDGRKLWTTRVPGLLPAGPPALLDGAAWIVGIDGTVSRLGLVDGSIRSRLRLNSLPAGGLLNEGPDLIVPSGLASFRILDTRAIIESSGVSGP